MGRAAWCDICAVRHETVRREIAHSRCLASCDMGAVAMGRGLWAVGFKRCRLAPTDLFVIGAFGALRCARLLPAEPASEHRERL